MELWLQLGEDNVVISALGLPRHPEERLCPTVWGRPVPRVTAGSWPDGEQSAPPDWKCSFQISRLELELYFSKFYIRGTVRKINYETNCFRSLQAVTLRWLSVVNCSWWNAQEQPQSCCPSEGDRANSLVCDSLQMYSTEVSCVRTPFHEGWERSGIMYLRILKLLQINQEE